MSLSWRCAVDESDQHLNNNQKRIWAALEAPGCAAPQQFSQDQAQIECAGMYEQPLDDVVMTTQMSSSHASGFVHMRKTSFHQFSTLTQQSFSALSSDPSPVLIDR